MKPLTAKQIDRFMRNIYRTDDDTDCDCWVWISDSRRGKRPVFRINETYYDAVKIAYRMFVGPIPFGHVVVNTCNNPLCIKAGHLTVITDAQFRQR